MYVILITCILHIFHNTYVNPIQKPLKVPKKLKEARTFIYRKN